MEDVGILYVHWVYLTVFLVVILIYFDVCYGHLVHFPVLVCCTKKNLATLHAWLQAIGALSSNSFFANSFKAI
jgi:hypothetical protein